MVQTKRLPRFLAATILWLLLPASGMAGASPDAASAQEMLSAVQRDMVAALQDPGARGNQQAIEALVYKWLVPHVDMERAAILVLGGYWKSATPEQRQRFVEEFRSFLVRFYAGALASYANRHDIPAEVMTFTRRPAMQGESEAVVHALVNRDNGQVVQVDYRLYLGDEWKVIDVSVGGMSMAHNYRSQFMTRVRQVGLDGLIAELAQRNSQLAGR